MGRHNYDQTLNMNRNYYQIQVLSSGEGISAKCILYIVARNRRALANLSWHRVKLEENAFNIPQSGWPWNKELVEIKKKVPGR